MAATWVKGKLGDVAVEGGARWPRTTTLIGSTVMTAEDSGGFSRSDTGAAECLTSTRKPRPGLDMAGRVERSLTYSPPSGFCRMMEH